MITGPATTVGTVESPRALPTPTLDRNVNLLAIVSRG